VTVTNPTRLYHTTIANRADSIMRNGFADNATVNKRLFSGTTVYTPRVWFSDVPAVDDELFDGVGLFNFNAEKQAFIAVDLCLPVRGIESSACDSTWPGTQYWAPASIWNRFPRTRLQLDDIIRLRLASDPKLRPMRQWIAEGEDPRPYGTAFHARVKKILAARNPLSAEGDTVT
jgi:hypothetical protein